MHGGDIYNNKVEYDFSVNVNPYGPYDEVINAVRNAVSDLNVYPEYSSEHLTEMIANYHGLNSENICVTNGASEAINSVINTPYVSDVIIETPSFYGYEKAVNPEQQIHTYTRNSFLKLNENLIPRNSVLVIGNPSNPTGEYTDIFKLESLYKRVKAASAILLVDESFIELSEYKDQSIINRINSDKEYYDRLVVVRSFTKSFAIPAIRLGYIVSSNERFISAIQNNLPEWNVSLLAQVAGAECIKNKDRLNEDVKKILVQKKWLEDKLSGFGFCVYKGCANYILFTAPQDLYARLLDEKILIRDCSDYRGIDEVCQDLLCKNMSFDNRLGGSYNIGVFRIAVKKEEENRVLIDTIERIIK